MSYSISQAANPIEFFGLRGIRFGFGSGRTEATERTAQADVRNDDERPLSAQVRQASSVLQEADSIRPVAYTAKAEPILSRSPVGVLLDLYA